MIAPQAFSRAIMSSPPAPQAGSVVSLTASLLYRHLSRLHERPEQRRVRVRARSASSSVKFGTSAGPGTSCNRGGASSRRPLSYPVRSPAWRPIRDPCPIRHGRGVPCGGTLSMRRRASAQLAFGNTPARPSWRKAMSSSIRRLMRLPERQRLPGGPASWRPSGLAAPRTAVGATASPEPPVSDSSERRAVRHDAVGRVPPARTRPC